MIKIFGWTVIRSMEVENLKEEVAYKISLTNDYCVLAHNRLEELRTSEQIREAAVIRIDELRSELTDAIVIRDDYALKNGVMTHKIKKLNTKIIKLKENQ